jgi:hypothetical protein
MRVHLIAVAMFVAVLMGQAADAVGQDEGVPPAHATPAPPSDPGVMSPIHDPPPSVAPPSTAAPRKRRAYAQSKAVASAEASQPAETVVSPPIEAPTLAHQLIIIRAEEELMDVLDGKSGPFAQAMAAWRIKDWYHFAFAMATLLAWTIILAIVAAAVTSAVRRRRESL